MDKIVHERKRTPILLKDMKDYSKVLIVGHRSLVGKALLLRLKREAFNRILTFPANLDLAEQRTIQNFFQKSKPEYVFLIDIKSGGIMANCAYPADFMYHNLQAQNNIIHSAWKTGTKKLIFMGSSCVYPKNCSQPIKEEYLLTGPLEATSEAFAMAKIVGIKMCQYYNRQYGTKFISVIPATVYGRNDNFNSKTSHVLPALVRKIYEAKIKKSTVAVWGTGKPRREFLHVDDLVDACIFMMKNYNVPEIINVGVGVDISIYKLAELIKEIIGFKGRINFDINKPDGVYRKLLDVSRIKSLGWIASVELRTGIEEVYHWYKKWRLK